MNKNFKVVQINGLSGILILGFISTGVFCGFIIFPIWIIMNAWNIVVGEALHGPVINYFQSLLLWFAIILSLYLILRNSISIKIQKEEYLEPKDIKDIIGEVNIDIDKEKDEIIEKEEITK